MSALLFSVRDLEPPEFDHRCGITGSQSWWHEVAELGPLHEAPTGDLVADVRSFRFHRDTTGVTTRTLCTTGKRALALGRGTT